MTPPTTTTAAGLHRFVLGVWCSECSKFTPCGTIYEDHKARGILRHGLWVRRPAVRPPWLDAMASTHHGWVWMLRGRQIDVAIASLLVLGGIVEGVSDGPGISFGKTTVIIGGQLAKAPTRIEAACIALHKFEDSQENRTTKGDVQCP